MATNNYIGENFLNALFKDLFKEDVVRNCSNTKDNKNVRVRKYLLSLRKMHEEAINNGYDGILALRELYYDKYIIKKDKFPKKFFDVRKKQALNRGYGHIEPDAERIEKTKTNIINDQKQSLDRWIDFILTEDKYPDWFKYYVFQGIVKIGSYDKSKKKINKRTSTTTNIFVGINYQAIEEIYNNLIKVLNGEKIQDSSLQRLLKNGNFGKIYLYMLNKINSNTDQVGLWRKYTGKEDYKLLVEDLQGKITNWCIEGYHSAFQEIREGSAFIYYTKDMNNNYVCPRIGMIVNKDGIINEVRGVDYNQALESEMEEIVSLKLNEFEDGYEYQKKDADMKKLTEIYDNKDRELSVENLKFLYEISSKIMTFSGIRDPRINEILSTRDWKEDFSKISGCSVEDIKNKIKKI